MHEQPPHPLGYRSPDPAPEPPDPQTAWRQFYTGLALGTAVSGVLWVGAGAGNGGAATLVFLRLGLVLVPLAKLLLGVALMSQPPRDSFGAGLLASLALCFLLMAGMCGVAATTH